MSSTEELQLEKEKERKGNQTVCQLQFLALKQQKQSRKQPLWALVPVLLGGVAPRGLWPLRLGLPRAALASFRDANVPLPAAAVAPPPARLISASLPGRQSLRPERPCFPWMRRSPCFCVSAFSPKIGCDVRAREKISMIMSCPSPPALSQDEEDEGEERGGVEKAVIDSPAHLCALRLTLGEEGSSQSESPPSAATDTPERKRPRLCSSPEEEDSSPAHAVKSLPSRAGHVPLLWCTPKSPLMLREATEAPRSPTLFRGISFVLTGLRDDTRSEQAIRECGGTLLRVSDAQQTLPTPTFRKTRWGHTPTVVLLSDRCHRTLNYLLALAAGVPTVHCRWVFHCAEQGTLLPFLPYLLPAGFSLESSSYSFLTIPRACVFDGMDVCVVGKGAFATQWSAVLRAGGATLVSSPRQRPRVVVSHSGADASGLQLATTRDVPVVSAEWVVQSLVNQRIVGFEADKHYSINYASKHSS